MSSASLTDDFLEPTYVGYFFLVFSGLVAFIASVFVWTKWDTSIKKENEVSADSEESAHDGNLKEGVKSNASWKNTPKRKKWKPDKVVLTQQFQHKWLYTTLKGHLSDVKGLDYSPNGKYLVSIGLDRSLYLWHVKDFGEREHKVHRSNVEMDNPNHIVFAPDSKSILMSLDVANKLDVYKMIKKDGTQSYKFSPVQSVNFPAVHKKDICSIGIACNGKFALSASSDNQLTIYSIHGKILKTIELKLNVLYEACISPCGRFVAASGFTPDVFVLEVLFDRQGNFQNVKKAFELKGHRSGIYSFGFDQSSARCVTASKDGTWKIYNTNVRYTQGEEAMVLASGEFSLLKNAPLESVRVAVSPSGYSFAISAGRHLRLYSTLQPTKEFPLILHVHDKPISCLRMSSCGKMLASCGDRYIRIFHNVAELYSEVVLLEKALQSTREDARRRRLMEQLQEAKHALNSFPVS